MKKKVNKIQPAYGWALVEDGFICYNELIYSSLAVAKKLGNGGKYVLVKIAPKRRS